MCLLSIFFIFVVFKTQLLQKRERERERGEQLVTIMIYLTGFNEPNLSPTTDITDWSQWWNKPTNYLLKVGWFDRPGERSPK